MTNSGTQAPADGGETTTQEPRGSFLSEWVLPIVLGLALGGGGVWVWMEFAHSKAWKIVLKYDYDDQGDNEEIAKELRSLGAGARGDVVTAFRDVGDDAIEAKIWVGHQLAGEPWFDTASLKEICKDGKASAVSRRAAAIALVDSQHKEVDTELVLPVFEEWLLDLSAVDHSLVAQRVDHMSRAGMLSSQWEGRIKKALIRVCDRAARRAAPPKEYADRIDDDRAGVILTLQIALPDEDAKKLLWSVAKDEDDDEGVRINSVRALAEGGVLDADTLADWTAVSKTKLASVRQTVADNLSRAKLPEFDTVLEPLQYDSHPFVRAGAIDSQTKRRRPTMMARFDEFVEDGEMSVRFLAMIAAGSFKNFAEGAAQRGAMLCRVVETSEDREDVQAAVIALKMITDEVYGFQATDVLVHEQVVEETALKTFLADRAGRKQAADKWRAKLGPGAVWTDADRRATLEKLLKSADEKTVERARALLTKLAK